MTTQFINDAEKETLASLACIFCSVLMTRIEKSPKPCEKKKSLEIETKKIDEKDDGVQQRVSSVSRVK